MIQPLLNRHLLEPGESMPSLIARLEASNYYRSTEAIADICHEHLPSGESIHLPHLSETWTVLADVTRLPASDLYRATFHRYAVVLVLPWETIRFVSLPSGERMPLVSSRMQRHFLRPLQNAQYCPACLKNGSHHRLSWLNLLTVICPYHKCLLQCGCPNCQQKLSVAAIVGSKCPTCENDLSTVPVISVSHDSWGLWTQLQLQSWWEGTTTLPCPDGGVMPDQPVPILLEVLRGLATAVARLPEAMLHETPCPDLPYPLFNPNALPMPVQVYCTYATAMKAMTCWPQAFHDFLDMYRHRPNVTVGQVTVEFAPLYLTWLEERWQRPEFAFIQDAFNDFLAANYLVSRSIARLDRYQRSQSFRDQFPYLTQREASERLDVEIEIVQRLVDMEILVNYECGEDKQRHWHQRLRIVRRTEFTVLQRQWQAGIPFADVIQILDVDNSVVENLVNFKLLTKCRHPSSANDSLNFVEKASLNKLVRGLNHYPAIPHNFGKPITLWELEGDGYDLVQVLKQALAGEVKSIWLGGSLHSVWLSRNDKHRLQK